MGFDRISKKIEEAIEQGIFPGAVLLCAVDQKIQIHQSYGMADIFNRTKMEKKSLFDLASLTKPLATTLAISRLLEKKILFPDQKIGAILPEFAESSKNDITIDMLLRHTSGYPAHRDYFRKIIQSKKHPRQYLRKLLVDEKLENKMNTFQVYSDLGFMVLSWIIEKKTGQRLDRFVQQEIYSRLEINNLFFRELGKEGDLPDPWRHSIVATQQCPWRKRLLKGEVDDDNAWAVGGIEGHAGLFGDAGSVYALCTEILNAVQGKPTKVLSSDIMRALVKKKNSYEMVAGFDTPSQKKSSSGRYFSSSSIGHLGFTGTSFWIDPEVSLVVVFLSNRVHPLRSNTGIVDFRPQLHDLIYTELM